MTLEPHNCQHAIYAVPLVPNVTGINSTTTTKLGVTNLKHIYGWLFLQNSHVLGCVLVEYLHNVISAMQTEEFGECVVEERGGEICVNIWEENE